METMQEHAPHLIQVLSSATIMKDLEIKFEIDSKEEVKWRYKRDRDGLRK